MRNRHRRAEGVQKVSQLADLIGGRDRLVRVMAALAHAALPVVSRVIHSHMKWLVKEAVAASSGSKSKAGIAGVWVAAMPVTNARCSSILLLWSKGSLRWGSRRCCLDDRTL